MLDILMAGGWPMLPILLCSAVMLAIVLERFWSLRHDSVLPPGLGEEVRQWARSRRLDLEHLKALADGSPMGELFAAALTVRDRPREIIKERIEDTGRHVVHRMERFLSTLGTIALIGPLLGLLGTVIGLIEMFLTVMVSGVGDPMKMAGGIGQALVCTATGLVVAIPAYILHRYFRSRVSGYLVEMEKQATALLDDLSAQPTPAAARAAENPAAARGAAAPARRPTRATTTR
ncbi:MAG TPA: MotA/TolQ/ExbB proton channel family protein [Oleiagrimonas sp.]|nr:MotA/TolQ/ExbB proton channel family protein [Oleiagrimonas sp.]